MPSEGADGFAMSKGAHGIELFSSRTMMQMGLFDGIMKAFSNEQVRKQCHQIVA